MAPRLTKRRLPPAGQLALPIRVPRLEVGSMLILEAGDALDHSATCERARDPYRWRPGDPIPRFGAHVDA